MLETYKIACLKCANKVHKEIKQIPLQNNGLILNVTSYICSKCGHINSYKDMFMQYK